MLRKLLLLLLSIVLLLPATALAHGTAGEPKHTETVKVGPYTLLLEFDTWPLRQARNFQVVVHPQGGMTGLKGEIDFIPTPGVKGQAYHDIRLQTYPGVEDGWMIQIPGVLNAGRWHWDFEIDGPQGKAQERLTLRFDEAPPFPQWLGWLIGLTPLWGLIWFAIRERRRVKRLGPAHDLSAV